jgi:hypothetical protein
VLGNDSLDTKKGAEGLGRSLEDTICAMGDLADFLDSVSDPLSSEKGDSLPRDQRLLINSAAFSEIRCLF